MTFILPELRSGDIPWALERLDRVERIDVLGLTDLELFDYAQMLQREVSAVRAIATAAINLVHERDRELEGTRREAGRLRAELRAQRTERAAA